jgi:hypothetical protein
MLCDVLISHFKHHYKLKNVTLISRASIILKCTNIYVFIPVVISGNACSVMSYNVTFSVTVCCIGIDCHILLKVHDNTCTHCITSISLLCLQNITLNVTATIASLIYCRDTQNHHYARHDVKPLL